MEGRNPEPFRWWKMGKFRRLIIQAKLIFVLHIIRNLQFGELFFHFIFQSYRCLTDRSTKVIWVIHCFIVFLESLNLFDVSRSTFVEFLLQRREGVSDVFAYCYSIHKLFCIIGSPPNIKILGVVVGEFKSKQSKYGKTISMSRYPLKVIIFAIVEGAEAQLIFLFDE